MIETRYANHPRHVARMDTQELRDSFLTRGLFIPGEVHGVYLHNDRILALGVVPLGEPLSLPVPDQVRAEHLMQRREAGIINLGGLGTVTVDGEEYELGYTTAMYLGRGAVDVSFRSASVQAPAAFYVFTATSHQDLPTTLVTPERTNVVELGSEERANRRTLHQCIYEGGTRSSQIAFGFTQVHPGNTWNTMPAHTHERRTECYLYFGMDPGDRVFHVMGQETETRHLVVADRELVTSPAWSLHFGCGTGAYTFVWATAGENTTYDDMDAVDTTTMR